MKFVILGLLFVASACASNYFCVSTFGTGTLLSSVLCVGTDGKTAATVACSCGSNNVAVAKDEFCFQKNDKTGAKSTVAIEACADDKTKGKDAAPANGCYCGTDGNVAASGKFCNTQLDAKGVISATLACVGTDGKTAAVAACSCGSDAVAVAKDAFCFQKTNTAKTGAMSTAATEACAANGADGKEAVATVGCYCGTGGSLSLATKAPTGSPTKAPTKAAAGGGATGNSTTVAAASTDGVNAGLAFTALCLAVTALRQ